MHKAKIALAVTAVSAAALTVYLKGSQGATLDAFLEKYPDADPVLAKKHYKVMFREALTGQFGDNMSSEDLDRELYRRVTQ